MAVFECRQAQEIRDACKKHGVRYLFIGKSAAILLGFPDTTQDADLLLLRTPENCRAILLVLQELGFALTDSLVAEIERGKDFVQLKNGPFDVDLIFAPDGIECFEDAWKRHMEVEGFPVCHIDDVIARSGFKTSSGGSCRRFFLARARADKHPSRETALRRGQEKIRATRVRGFETGSSDCRPCWHGRCSHQQCRGR